MSEELVKLFPSSFYKDESKNDKNADFTGVKILDDDAFAFCFVDGQMEIDIYDIREISYEQNKLQPQYNGFLFISDSEKESHFFKMSEIFLDAITLKELMEYLLEINPQIKLCSEIQKIIGITYTYSDMPYFNFKKERKDNSHGIVINTNRTQTTFAVISVFLMIFCIAGFPIIGGKILEHRRGTNFGEYRILLLFISGFSTSMFFLNILLALLSKYKGHIVSLFTLLIASVSIIFAFI